MTYNKNTDYVAEEIINAIEAKRKILATRRRNTKIIVVLVLFTIFVALGGYLFFQYASTPVNLPPPPPMAQGQGGSKFELGKDGFKFELNDASSVEPATFMGIVFLVLLTFGYLIFKHINYRYKKLDKELENDYRNTHSK